MTRQGEPLGIENFSSRCSKDLKCYLNKFVKTFLNILVDRLHPVGGWQILWVEAVGGLVGGLKARKAGKAWRLVPGYRPRPHETQLPSSVVARGGWPVVLLPMCEYLVHPHLTVSPPFYSAFPVMFPIHNHNPEQNQA